MKIPFFITSAQRSRPWPLEQASKKIQGGVVGKGQLGGPRRRRLPPSSIINSSWGRLYTFFLRCHTPFPHPTPHLNCWFTRQSLLMAPCGADARSLLGRQDGKGALGKCLGVVGLWQVMNRRVDCLAVPIQACFVLLKQQQMTQSINVKYVD